MTVIKPISDLRNKSNEVSRIAHRTGEPVFITKNGEGDLVLMSMACYSRMMQKLELYGKLAVAQGQRATGGRGRPLASVMKDVRKRLREQA